MSKEKAQKKVANGSKKTKPEKPDAGMKAADKTANTADTISVDNTKSAPKSASQSSISHFSSVSTPAYKAGWESIFGASKIDQKRTPNTANGDHIPEQLTIDNEDIDKELRNALFKAFQRQARKKGISLAKIEKRVEFDYTLSCNLKGK